MNLILESGQKFTGKSIGADTPATGEIVFTTGMAGYLETCTDPSYFGQIIVFTYPLIGNYGVPDSKSTQKIDEIFESPRIHARGIILAESCDHPSHELSRKKFTDWCREQKIPVLAGIDTRHLTQILRERGTMLAKIGNSDDENFNDSESKFLRTGRFVPEVSPKTTEILEPKNPSGKTIVFLDCGAKNGIFRQFLNRGIRILRLPFDRNPFDGNLPKFDGIFISNGPGDPATHLETVEIVRNSLQKNLPIFGICLGNQILALAAGAKTRKMKYGHRGVNQPVQNLKSKKGIITTQNHGFEIDPATCPSDFEIIWKNSNDGSIEGIAHRKKPIFAVQFHPEACAGPLDAEFLFDEFVAKL